jgi:phage nucleotide-binding protein
MQMSYSRVSSFEQCPFKWKLRYIDELETIDKCDPGDALKLGTALHEGIEIDVDTAIGKYFRSYPIITDIHENEAMKLRALIPKAKALLPEGGEFEVKLECDDFKGFIDYLVPVHGRTTFDETGAIDGFVFDMFDIYDFKYSNNVNRYMESEQLHVYKYFAEKLLGIKIRNLYFLFVPKTQIRQKKTEDLFQFRKRLSETLETMEPRIKLVEYDPNKVIDFLTATKHVVECEEYEKRESRLCDWCEYQNYCQKGSVIDMVLPSTERIHREGNSKKRFWIYGAPFSGKTTFADNAPTPLNLNTDGNIKNVTMPALPIKDTFEGRIKKFGWEIFKEAIDDLEKGSDFETIVVDLIEDTYEMCRLYMYDKLGITHESDDSFRAWDKVRTEYLSTMRKLLNLDYNIILNSHEDRTRDFTSRNGEKYSTIKPNINDKVANKLAGMVDFVGRIVVDGDRRTLEFKSDDVIFGGGRLDFGVNHIPLEWSELMNLYDELSVDKGEKNPSETKSEVPKNDKTEESEEETPKRTRKARTPETTPEQEEPREETTEEPEEKPVRRRRRRTTTEE